MTKKDARDRMVALIFMTTAGKVKLKETGEVLTLDKLRESELFKKAKACLAEKGISRKSVYKAIESKGYFGLEKAEVEEKLKIMYDFCYTYLDKNS